MSRLEKTNVLSNAQPRQMGEQNAIAALEAGQSSQSSLSKPTAPYPQVGRQYVAPLVDRSRIVQRPTPRAQTDDPRSFQIEQLKRRYSPTEVSEKGGTALTFQMVPSDPDFPFEMDGLECVLHVPLEYPKDGKPSLDIKNKEMDRGYQINVERGFDALVAQAIDPTLLSLITALDKQLESLLTEEKAQTIKITPNAETRQPSKAETQATQKASQSLPPRPLQPNKPAQLYTPEQRRTAQARREAETRRLEARLGRLPLFSRSSDGITYTVPIEPRRCDDLPVPLQAVKTGKLFVPPFYPLEHCRIELQGVAREAATKTERGFERKAIENSEANLMGHINFLAQHMHTFATEPEPESVQKPLDCDDSVPPVEVLSLHASVTGPREAPMISDEDSRSHIKVIPRPPEWTAGSDDEASDDSEYSNSYGSGDESANEEYRSHTFEAVPEVSHDSRPERGISLSFPNLELYGIEVLELVSLSVTVKCERCKDTLDISNLRSASGARSESCKKCAGAFNIEFRRELIHANSIRAGYLDLDGCTVVDMLPR